MSKYYVIKNGKKTIKTKPCLPNGLYTSFHGDEYPTLMDESYNGFKITYLNAHVAKSNTNVINDSIEVKGLHDGKTYSSKSRYYQSLKETGNHIVEKGEFNNKPRQIQGDYNVRKELKQAIQQHLGS